MSFREGTKRMKISKRYLSVFLLLLMVVFMTAACSGSSGDASAADDQSSEEVAVENQVDPNAEIIYMPEGTGISFDEEIEDAQLEFVESDTSAYIGSWESTSDRATYLYGNVDLTIKDDGTWTGNITEEDFEGTWEAAGDHIHMNNEIFSFDLSFEKSGKLILIETGDDHVFYTVLTEK